MLNQIIESCPKEVDLTNDRHSEIIIETVTAILKEGHSFEELEQIEEELISRNDQSLIFVLLALKLAKSKLLAAKVSEPLLVSIVFAVYKEHNRIRTSSEHPHGEDFLRKKISQLEWLFADQPHVKWEFIIVDDGCPEGSGKIAQSIIDENGLADKARVRYLAEAIEQQYPPATAIATTSDSQKGGSVVYGMWDAIQGQEGKNQIVIFTDADLSTHLGQVMLLVDPILNEGKLAAIGSRREAKSVVIKKGSRNSRGKLFIYLWKRLIPNLGEVIDTQCGFKAFKADVIPTIIDDLIEKKFAFDIELLLRTALQQADGIRKVPVAWIDSEAASTTTDLQPYLSMLKSIVKMYQQYFSANELSDEFASFISGLTEEAFQILLENIPEEITSKNPDAFTTYNEVRVADLMSGTVA